MTEEQLKAAMRRMVARRDDCIKQAKHYRKRPTGGPTADRYDMAAAGFDTAITILRKHGAPWPLT